MPRYINVDALWRDVTSNIEDCGDVLEIIERLPVVTINDHPEEIKVTNCNHNSDSGKKDAIYRHDVIDILNQYYCAIEQANGRPVTKEEQVFYFALKIAFAWLPSAQPEIVRCKDCRFYTEMRTDLKTGICSLACRHLGDDGFCSEAERRSDE